MATCQVIRQSWTFSGLVGAFLDLGITYFLLCCSAIAFFISNFLAFFGLSLPCPCNGIFGYPNHGYCMQRILADYPTKTISNLQLSVKSKFPFDAILARNDHCLLNLKLVKERKLDDGGWEFDGEASYSSFSDPRRSQQSFSGSDSFGKFDINGKGSVSQRPRCGGFRRRRRGTIDYGKFSSSSSLDYTRSDIRAIQRSPSDSAMMAKDLNVDLLKQVKLRGRTVSDFASIGATDEGKPYGNATSFENLESTVRHVDGIGSEDENSVRILEQALEEEHAARMALCSDLEQERIAAATAADEAMAMISRLQEEKAAIEMEARQYQRILEEKSSYDAEEMDILKEIIIRREREKHFLEREVEAYRKVLGDNEGSDNQVDDAQDQNEDSSVNPMVILQQLSESIDKSGANTRNYFDNAAARAEKQTLDVSSGKDILAGPSDNETKIVEVLDHPECSTVCSEHLLNMDERFHEVQEKGMLSMNEIRYPQLSETNVSRFENDLTLIREEVSYENVYPHQKLVPVVGRTDEQMLEQVREPLVHDIHVIGSKYEADKMTGKGGGPRRTLSDASSLTRQYEPSFEAPKELNIVRTCSDVAEKLLSVNSSTSRGCASELRRNSLPTVDLERLKIDNEVEWLRTRLRAVQEEKEKLKTSLDRQERGKTELQLLEDIAKQIREIRHLTEPEKAARQGFLPPLSAKVAAKKRRSRSISSGPSSVGHCQSN